MLAPFPSLSELAIGVDRKLYIKFMPTEKNFEQSPESQFEKEFQAEIKDLSDFSGLTLEEISKSAIKNILDDIEKNIEKKKSLEGHYRRKFNLSDDQPLTEALQYCAQESLEKYHQSIVEKKQSFQKQAEDCYNLAKKRGYITEAKKIDIIISNPFLNKGLERLEYKIDLNTFNPDLNSVIIDCEQTNRALAHEMGHALSYYPEQSKDGFRDIVKKPDGKTTLKKNYWFNEGVTIIWEELSVNDDSVIPSRNDPRDSYYWYRETTRLILKESVVSDELALRAYFGNEETRQTLEDKINNRFNCSLDDLECLSFSQDIGMTKKIIAGEKVELKIKKSTHETVIKIMKKLSEIFPNVSIKEVKE